VKTLYGIDIDESAIDSAREVEKKRSNFKFIKAGADSLPFEDSSFDIVISNIMYNLLSPDDQQRMFDEIHRCLKPQGICYFAAPNKLLILHGKYKLPFLDLFPAWFARGYARLLSPVKERYDEYPKSLFGLRKLVRNKFREEDVTLELIDNPHKYKLYTAKNRLFRIALSVAARIFYIFMPNFIFILQKK
jgi:ubiquinone/menaquinone biosynthesis C-methylase UbiE